MAETCIVCLGDLKNHNSVLDNPDTGSNSKGPLRVPNPDATLDKQQPATQDSEPELVAHLLPCGHFLHDECLKPWVERANSCPICRQTFNMVELSDSLGGPVISTYAVQDKQQVADIDPSLIIDDEDPHDLHTGPCFRCEAFGDDAELMYCDGCSNTCHVLCAGLDSVPRGTFFCQMCQEDPQILASNYRPTGTTRRARNRAARPQAWERVWRTVYDRLDFDLDFPFEQEDASAERRAAAQRREVQAWQRRFAVAERQGAATRFRDTAVILREHQRNRPSPESQEEIKAWNAFEKFRAMEESEEGQQNRNRRKRKSPTASPRDAPAASERKLKRPRTRAPNVGGGGGEASETVAESSRAAPPRSRPSAPRPRRPLPQGAGGPTFLQSLLNEVEANPGGTGSNSDHVDYGSDFMSGNERSPSPRNDSSPDGSPTASNHPSPRAMTPPPHSPVARPASPAPLTSIITPIYPPAPEFSPFSPAETTPQRARSKHRTANSSSPAQSPSHSPTRAPISYEMKAEIQKMVTAALKPHYQRKELGKDAYTDINRDVSRMLYDKVWDAGGLIDVATRDRFQRVAAEEVALAVKVLKKPDQPTETPPEAVDSAAPDTPTFTAVVRA
ncbi:hypothetical protein EJ08DRAFT_466268 [Tothia fuscella]|uniref:RING-type domain-containing protein n=1 Tax=Tothia fuscella TaxID=1048955 RepID=A0A9P4U239_9PEZI|nr:hypothetical protein EJ08DRAFT_466268 [Tothia fuscella]